MKSPGTVLGLTALLGLVAIYVRVESLAGHARPRRAPAARASHADTPQVPRLASAKGSSDLEKRIADLERELEESPSPDTTPATGPTELATFAEQLQLTDPQKRQVEATVTRGKQRVEDLLRIPDEEGVRPVDRRRDHRAKLRAAAERGDLQAVLRLFAEAKRSSNRKIPGLSTTYGEEMERIRKETREEIAAELSTSQRERLSQASISRILGVGGPVTVRVVAQ